MCHKHGKNVINKVLRSFFLTLIIMSFCGFSSIAMIGSPGPGTDEGLTEFPRETPRTLSMHDVTKKENGVYEDTLKARLVTTIEGAVFSFDRNFLFFKDMCCRALHYTVRFRWQHEAGFGVLALEEDRGQFKIGFHRNGLRFVSLATYSHRPENDDLFNWLYAGQLVNKAKYGEALALYRQVGNGNQLGPTLIASSWEWISILAEKLSDSPL